MDTTTVDFHRETVRKRGVSRTSDAVRIKGRSFVFSGKFVRTLGLQPDTDAWRQDVDDPEEIIRALRDSRVSVDLFRFWQRIPEGKPKYNYYHEWRDVAALPIADYQAWWEKQINSNTRRLVRKSEKQRVIAKEAKLDDELIQGITTMFNECPVRRGKRFWHYGKDFEAVKRDMSLDLDQAVFIAAYLDQELIGFIKLILADRYAMITLILDKMAHREKAPMNAMIAKAVQICADRSIPFLTYTLWRRGGHAYFQQRNGFQKVSVPEYYVPLTLKGRIALQLGLHKGLKGLIPESLNVRLLAVRAKWYSFRYPGDTG